MNMSQFKLFCAFAEEYFAQKYTETGFIFTKEFDANNIPASIDKGILGNIFGNKIVKIEKVSAAYSFSTCPLFKRVERYTNAYVFNTSVCEKICEDFIGLFNSKTMRTAQFSFNQENTALVINFNLFDFGCALSLIPSNEGYPFMKEERDTDETGFLFHAIVTLLNTLHQYNHKLVVQMIFNIMTEDQRVDLAESMLAKKNLAWRDYVAL